MGYFSVWDSGISYQIVVGYLTIGSKWEIAYGDGYRHDNISEILDINW